MSGRQPRLGVARTRNNLSFRKFPTYHHHVLPDIFGALANPSRRTILHSLRGGPLTAGELTGRLELSRSSASEHLSVLKDAGLVSEERQGRHRIYHLQAAPLQEVSTWLKDYEQYWNQRLDALADLLDGQSTEQENTHD